MKNWPPTVWQSNLAKIETWQKLTSAHAYLRARIVVAIGVSL
jgi:hypothetical protein